MFVFDNRLTLHTAASGDHTGLRAETLNKVLAAGLNVRQHDIVHCVQNGAGDELTEGRGCRSAYSGNRRNKGNFV